MKWIYKWKSFVNGVTVEAPGPITNLDLYESYMKDNQELLALKDGLVRNKDYKMANEYVWNFLYYVYGGGPSIVRKEKDIYSD